jgi:hypothetical protein
MTARQLAAVRGGWGAWLLLAPSGSLRWLTGGRQPKGGRTLLRVLGARHVLQAAGTLKSPTAWTLRLGAVADTLHAASGLAFAAVDDQERRAGLLDAAVAATWAVASLRATPR